MSTPEDAALALLEMIEEKLSELTAMQVTTREMTIELHQATKDARQAARDLKKATGDYGGDVGRYFDNKIAKGLEELTAALEKSDELLKLRLKAVDKAIRDYFAELLGAKDADALMAVVIKELMETIGPQLLEAINEGLQRKLPGIVRTVLAQKKRGGMDADLLFDFSGQSEQQPHRKGST